MGNSQSELSEELGRLRVPSLVSAFRRIELLRPGPVRCGDSVASDLEDGVSDLLRMWFGPVQQLRGLPYDDLTSLT